LPHRFHLRRDLNNGAERWVLYETQRRGRTKVGSLKGWRLSLTLPYIRKILHQLKLAEDSNPTHFLPEEEGVRLALTFLGIRNLRKLEKAENLCRQIHSMSQEETYYWYAKALARRPQTSGIRALRILYGN